jgi:hypothetical protein
VSGGLAVAGLSLSLATLLTLVLVWLLADPVLGVIWEVGVGNAHQRGIWRRLISPRLPDRASPSRLLPYTQVGSPGYRLARHLGSLGLWWRETLWPEAGREFATLAAGLVLALFLGAILGREVLILVLVSVLLSWLAMLSVRRFTTGGAAQGSRGRRDVATLWRALGEFGVAWLIGSLALGGLPLAPALLGVCYMITYFGLIRGRDGFRLIVASQVAAALLLAGLRHPVAAGATAILFLPQWGLHTWATRAEGSSDDRRAIFEGYQRYAQPFVVVSMLIAALAVGS